AWCHLVQNHWRIAWEAFEGGQQGFAADVGTALEALANRRDSTTSIGAQWRCALVLSSINSLGRNLPRELLVAAASVDILSIGAAAYFASLDKSQSDSVKTLVMLAGLS